MTLENRNPAPVDSRAASAGDADVSASLRLMERVADWQLGNPIGFDIYSRRGAGGDSCAGEQLTRVGWDGAILHRLDRAVKPLLTTQAADDAAVRETLPAAWHALARMERDDIAFSALPVAAQAAWFRATGQALADITCIRMYDCATRGWEMGALYHGLLELASLNDVPAEKRDRYRAALRLIGEASAWRPGERVYHADDHCAGYMYLEFFEETRDPLVLAGVQSRFDWIMRNPSAQGMTIAQGQQRWTWCDALFMAPPVWARLARVTSDRAYLDFMDREWRAAAEHLYSSADRLFFRDATYFDRREANGAKIFWSRGNGWVLAGLARVLGEMPADYPARARYVALFREMAERIASLQPGDGLWRASLLDAAAHPGPEASGSAFLCHALAWGINNGHLERARYEPIVLKAWAALCGCVHRDGRVGRIQQPGGAPGSADENSTAPYGVGAFLLAGAETCRMRVA